MNRLSHICSILLIGIILLSCSEEQSTITVNGNATIKVPVDYVKFTLGLNSQGSNLKELEDSSYKTMLKLNNILLEQWQFQDSLIQTNGSSIEEQYSNNSQRTQYRFSQQLTVTLDSLELYDTLRRDLIDAGATRCKIQTFGTFSNEASKQEALKKAYQNALHKANLLAENADFSIGSPKKISTSGRFNIRGLNEEYITLNSELDLAIPEPRKNTLIKKSIEVDAEVDVIFTLN